MTAEKAMEEARALATEAADSIEWAMENFMPAKGETGAGCQRRRTIEVFTEAMLAYRDQVRREVVEECARVADSYYDEAFATRHENRCFKGIARQIRALSAAAPGEPA